MKFFYGVHEWKVIEDGFHPAQNRVTESIMSLGNGYMGMRGNFEESYSGDSLQGTYIAGVYYPDRTVVGWWKVGYPKYFAKVLNAVNFIGIDVTLDGTTLDLHNLTPQNFKRVLDMRHGHLTRSFQIEDPKGRLYSIETQRFISRAQREIAAIQYSITLEKNPADENPMITLRSYLDGHVMNEDANYNEDFWIGEHEKSTHEYQVITMGTKKSDFLVSAASTSWLELNQTRIQDHPQEVEQRLRYASANSTLPIQTGQTLTLTKLVSVTTSRDFAQEEVEKQAIRKLQKAQKTSYGQLLAQHSAVWEQIWRDSDIEIKGDVAAQQGIRFNIFHLNQTYTGEDPRLNIGPKGFTGEKYGGSTYWDTEAYCLPFYLSTSDPHIPRNLLLYRYHHLEKAKENARKLGLSGALYPMVTVTGEECHNEWEITFEEIHRNGAIAYAIFNYVRYTGDKDYLAEYGFEVLAEIARFWASRVNYHPKKDKYMILGVTGPNEYENNVNNNWYTNRIAVWTLEYTFEVINHLKETNETRLYELLEHLGLTETELDTWRNIIDKMYYPYVESFGVFEQQDGFMDKELLTAEDIPKEDLPLNQNWSWDRILRSCFIKQADVLQGLFFLGDRYDLETKKRNFDFYEPMTVHESSLSPCVHSIIAAEIGYKDRAYELYLRTARLDLDNYNKDTDDGLHITSMAGTWMSVVYGFGGMRIVEDTLSFQPFIPDSWKQYSFKILFRGHRFQITVKKETVKITQEEGDSCKILVHGASYNVGEKETITIPLPI